MQEVERSAAQRPDKKNALGTVKYEISMLHYCCERVQELEKSDADRREYYLAIEGFLLHYRILCEFLSSKKIKVPRTEKSDDVTLKTIARIRHPLSDEIAVIESAAIKAGSEHWVPLNKFLAHMTEQRHLKPSQDWPIPEMFSGLLPAIHAFEDACSLERTPAAQSKQVSGGSNTETATTQAVLAVEKHRS